MEFKIGSLADLISANKSSSKSKHKKLFETSPSEKEIVKFKTVKKFKKSKWKVEGVKNTNDVTFETSLPVEINQEVKKRDKRKSKSNTDFNEEDETENEINTKPTNASCAKKRLKYKKKKEIETKDDGRKEREVFVGNVPHDITKKKLTQLFKKYGKVESVRLRCAPLSDPRIPKKVAIITKKFHPNRNSMHAFIRFFKPASAKKAVEANGICFENHHLRVDLVLSESQHDLKRAVFLGNVPFAAEEDDLWKLFEPCGSITSIRVIRDRYTGVGKGFAYINFENADSVELALKLDGTELNKRELRVKRCIKKPIKAEVKKEKSGKGKKQKLSVSEHKSKKRKHEDSDEKIKEIEMFDEDQSKENTSKKVKKGHKVNKKLLKSKITDEDDETPAVDNSDSEKSKKSFSFKTSFQGQKTAEDKKLRKKKKGKINKAELKKMSLIKKISSKSKPSMKKVKKPALKIKSAAKKMKFKP